MATISIADNDARVQYTQAVTANSTTLTIDFPFFDLDDIKVIVTTSAGVDTTITRGTGTGTFAVSGTAVDDGYSGGSVTLGDSYDNTHTYTIYRDIEASRTTDFATSGPFNIASLNTELDKIYAIIQQIETENNRALTLPQSDATASITLPTKSSRLGKYLAFHESTGLAVVGGDVADTGTVATQAANISTLAGINANITTVAGIHANVTTVAGISSNVTTVAGIQANVTTLATGTTGGNANLTQINTVAGSISNVNTVATNISNVNALAASAVITDMSMLAVSDVISDMNTLANADVIADMNTLATSDIISDLNTLATSDIVTDMNLLATSDNVTAMGHLGTSANVTAMGLLGTSAVVEDMGLLGTSANITAMGNLGTSTNVSNMTNLNASGVISNIATVAGAVSNVNTVATNISGVNSFADRYRVSSSAPTSSLDVGDLYFDTTANELKVYKSSGWSAAGSTVNGTSARFHYNISGTPTTVTGADASGNTLAYDAGFIDVYVNGVRMSPDDITVSSGTSVVFASALADGDDVDIVAYGTFNVANIVSTGALNSGSITSGFGNIDTGSSTITTTGAISGGTLTGTLQTAAQTNITSVGTLTGLTVGDNAGGDINLTTNSQAGTSGSPLNMDINFKGYNNNVMAIIRSHDESSSTGHGELQFHTTKAGVGTTEKLKIDHSGNLIIPSDASDFTFATNSLHIGASSDIKIGHTNNNNVILSDNGMPFSIYTDVFRCNSADNSESLFGADKDDAFFAKYNNLTTLKTTASGMIAYAQGSESSFVGQLQSLGTSNSSSNSLYLVHFTNHFDSTSIFIQASMYGSGQNFNRFLVYSNGATYNASNTYGNISDERLKSDITDAKSQWDDIKAIKVRNFKKYDTGDLIQLGLVAQELEKVSPSLIEEVKPSEADATHNSDFGEVVDDLDNPILYTDDDKLPNGKKVGDVKEYKKKVNVKEKVKAIKYSVLYMKAVKALQEAMARIETLEAKVKALEEA